jgi:hypothetical protein
MELTELTRTLLDTTQVGANEALFFVSAVPFAAVANKGPGG